MIRTRLERLKHLDRLKNKDTMKSVAIILSGKMLGIASLLGIIKGFSWFFNAAAFGLPEAAPLHAANDFVSPINTVWVLVTAFLVFFMQAGFMALEAGFSRSRETVNILMECVFDTCLCGVLYWAIGFAFQFGTGNGLIGHEFFFLNGITASYGTTGVAFLAFFLFQFA
ncbi:MAG: ammonium transporter, Amt family, partial [Acidimicrobiaceae bacterium]